MMRRSVVSRLLSFPSAISAAAFILTSCGDGTGPGEPGEITASSFSALSPGGSHTCGLTANQAAYCWGYNEAGALGDGTTISRASPAPAARNLDFSAVFAGEVHTCGLTPDGTAHCWGLNSWGQLGTGGRTDAPQTIPAVISGGIRFTALSLGWLHSCGLTAAGTAFCWGRNIYGFVGDGSSTDRLVPTRVEGVDLSFVAIDVGNYQSCGLTTGGAVYCWGFNFFGELGDGTTTTRLSPVRVAGGVNFTAISVGAFHGCGLTSDGTAYCWGYNAHGQLGDGTTTDRWSPVPVAGGLRFSALHAGGQHTCALTSAGAAHCWGWNNFGQLGIGDAGIALQLSPVLVAGGLSFAALRSGFEHTCGTTAARVAYCWGENAYGQLGDGSTTVRYAPTRMMP